MRFARSRGLALVLPLLVGLVAACGDRSSSSGADEEGDSTTEATVSLDELEQAAAEEGSLTWFTVLRLESSIDIANDFMADHPDIEVTVERRLPGPLIETLLADFSRGRVQADVLTLSSRSDLDGPLEVGAIADYVPLGADDLRPDAREAEPAAVATYLGAVTWAFRSDLPEDIVERFRAGDWSMFEDPDVVDALRGRVANLDPSTGGSAIQAHAALIEAWGEDEYWDFVENRYAELEPQQVESNAPIEEGLASGELVAAFTTETAAINTAESGIEFAYFDPTPAFPALSSLAADSPHPNAAKLFLSWLVSESGQRSLETRQNGRGVRADYVDHRSYTEAPWYDAELFPPDRIHVLTDQFLADFDREDFLARWTSAVQ